ncbi:MAG TPA: ATP-binding protein [Thermoanaerobaculia bacterium]|nr:ATP-binding protein [Thermoanaerobaculia bacterium]
MHTIQQLAAHAPNFRLLFELGPALYLALLPDAPRFTIVGVTEGYLAATMTRREAIVGRGLFEVFPDNPDDPQATGTRNLRASLQRVIARRAADTMAVQKYDIRKPQAEGGHFEERYWSPRNTPIMVDGEVGYILHRVEDVTDFVRAKAAAGAQQQLAAAQQARADHMELELYTRAAELQEANRELRQLHQQLEQRVEERTAELRQTEDQLRQAQKLEAVARLAGGIAHDFNNLLTVVIGHADLLLNTMAAGSAERGDVEQIKRAGERAAGLTRQLLAFSRQQVLVPKLLDLNRVLGGLQPMIGTLVGEDVDVSLRLAPKLGTVRADHGQIEQVVMNLVVNARDALPNGGKLTIETSDVVLDQHYADHHAGVAPGPYVMLAVSDNGFGMDKATQARIFEPFFTTKELGKGTGLGLSTVFGIVKQSGGHIWLYSEPGQGTTFKLYFPLQREEPQVELPAEVRSARARATETILFVEDDAAVRKITSLILGGAGYHVLEAAGAEEALLIAEQHPATIHALLTDVVMPKMNGRELAERVQAMRERIKVVFTSGYTGDVVLHHGVLEAGVHFVEKPMTSERLLHKLRQVLDA